MSARDDELALLRASIEQLTAMTAGIARKVEAAPAVVDPGPQLALREMADVFLATTRRTRAESTLEQRKGRLALFLAWASTTAGVTTAGGLTRGLVEAYDDFLRTVGHRVACRESSRRQIVSLVLRWWWWCRDREEWHGRIPTPPKRLDLPTPIPPSVHAATWAQADAMIAEVAGERNRRAAVLMRCLGWRVGQICRLRWSDFGVELERIKLRGELGKSIREKAGRVCPNPRALRDEMVTWWRPSVDDYLIPRGRGRHGQSSLRSTVAAVRRALRKAWVRSGAPAELYVGRPDHALRRVVRSELRHAGLPSDAIEFWCGRRTGGETDTYTDPRTLELQRVADAVPPLHARARGAPLIYLFKKAS